MKGIDIVIVFAVILFARLGYRLIAKYVEMKRNKKNNSEDDQTL